MLKNSDKNRKGFTIIELLLVLAISVILIAVSTLNFGNSRRKAEFDQTQKQIVSLLGDAQARAINQDQSSSWGVHIDNSTTSPFYALFMGSAYSFSSDRGHYSLSNNVSFSSTTPPGTSVDIVFSQITGNVPGAAPPINLVLKNITSVSSTITVSSSGLISY